jgi:hypothetical protein
MDLAEEVNNHGKIKTVVVINGPRKARISGNRKPDQPSPALVAVCG